MCAESGCHMEILLGRGCLKNAYYMMQPFHDFMKKSTFENNIVIY